jgi:hypothetical protein
MINLQFLKGQLTSSWLRSPAHYRTTIVTRVRAGAIIRAFGDSSWVRAAATTKS